MMKKNCKTFTLTMLSSALFTAFTAVAATDDLYDYPDTLFYVTDSEELKWDIVNDDNFKKPIYYLGHYLGYGWAGGTASQYVGEDLTIIRTGSNSYALDANYNSNDPYASGYWADKRLEVDVQDMKFYTEPDKLTLGTAQIYDRTAIASGSSWAINCADEGNDPDQLRVSFTYNTGTSWNRDDNFSFSESISIAHSHEVDLTVYKNTTTITGSFTANQGWTESNGGSTMLTVGDTYVATLPPQTKRLVSVTMFEQVVDIPYESEMYLSYNLKFYNFLRYGGNARTDHPTDRPFHEGRFGTVGGLNASEDLLDQYKRRDINGYSEWDWQWVLNNDGNNGNNARWAMGNIAKRKFGGNMTGKFTTVDATQFQWVGGSTVPVEPGDCDNKAASKSQQMFAGINDQQRLENSASKIENSSIRLKAIENKSYGYGSDKLQDITLNLGVPEFEKAVLNK